MHGTRAMGRLLGSTLLAAGFLVTLAARGHAASFGAGHIVICRVGDGTETLADTGNSVFLDEYTTGGTLVQSIPLPTAANGNQQPLVLMGGNGGAAGGNGSSPEGLIADSADGRFVILAGYGAAPGGATALNTTACTDPDNVPRVVARVKFDGTVDTSTALTDVACASNVRSATSDDGTNLWVGGNGTGASYATLGATTSTQLDAGTTNVRQLQIFGGQLFAAVGSATVSTIGSGKPTTAGQTTTALPGLPAGSPDGFFFASLPGGTVLYLADDTAGDIEKYSLVSGTWTANGSVGLKKARGVFGTVSGSTVTLYMTNASASVQTLADASGFNGTLTGSPMAFVTGSNVVYKGIAAAPVGGTAATATPAGSTPTPTPTATFGTPNGATVTPTRTPTGAAPTATPTAVSTPVATQGFVPPDKATGKCEDTVAKNLEKLATCIRKCHVKQADQALKQKLFDEEACENGAGKAPSCRAKYDAASAALGTAAICPACLDVAAQSNLADLVLASLESEAADVYCAGNTAFGGDDGGHIPPDKASAKCEDAVAKNVGTFAGCVGKCESKQADVELKAKTFDKNACVSAGKSACRTKYDAASAKLEQAATCPSCLDTTARGSVADGARDFLEQNQAQIYCAGTVPLQ